MRVNRFICAFALFAAASFSFSQIPAAAWRIPIGAPPPNPGGQRTELHGVNIDDGPMQGAPVGGFGAGTFSRAENGHFVRWHMKAGIHKYQDVPTNQFAAFAQPEGGAAVAMALATGKPKDGALGAWNWNYPVGDGEYAALYPKSWFSYGTKALPVKLTVEQFSPILPDNYKESSYPVAVYRWTAENPTAKPMTVSLLFSWTNMVGWFRDGSRTFEGALNQQNTDHFVTDKVAGGTASGIVFDRLRQGAVEDEWDGQFAIATLPGDKAEVTYLATYPVSSDGAEVWKSFSKDGRLPNQAQPVASSGDAFAGAFAVKFTLAPHEKRLVPMVVSWDLPVFQFGGGRKWNRHYTKFFGTEGTHAWEIARTALEHQEEWSKAIDAWQTADHQRREEASLVSRRALQRALRSWPMRERSGAEETNLRRDKPRMPAAKTSFTYLECFDYPFYGSLDVRFYGTFSLLRFWPEIEKQEMREYTETIPESNPQHYIWGWKSLRENRSSNTRARWRARRRTTWARRTKIRSSIPTSTTTRTFPIGAT